MPRRADDRAAGADRPGRAAGRGSARLSREAIVAAGVALADRGGLEALSMRRLAQDLGVDAMAIYYHLRDKEALLTAMADAVLAEIPPTPDVPDGDVADGGAPDGGAPDGGVPWTRELLALVLAARGTMVRHPWAVRAIEGRGTATPAMLRHLERVVGIMRRGGCSVPLSHHALHLLGSRVLGFNQDLFDDAPDPDADPAAVAAQLDGLGLTHPHLAELARSVSHDGRLGPCDDEDEFRFAMQVMLDGLERRRMADAG